MTTAGTASRTRSISVAVVQRPSVKQSEPSAASRSQPISVVAAGGGDAEERPESRRLELGARSGFDVAREQADDRVRPRAQSADHLGHAGEDLDP